MGDNIDFPRRLGVEFFDRLKMTPEGLMSVPNDYHDVRIPKRSGGQRELSIPNKELLVVQRRLNKAILRFLPKSKHAMGFVPFRSIAKHAARHASRRCVVRLDITDFFGTTSAERVSQMFRRWEWSDAVVEAVTRLCSHPSKAGLPQGAATSPTLSNVVNLELDRRLAGLATRFSGRYSRYADDITFSFSSAFHRTPGVIGRLLHWSQFILSDYGYTLNRRKTAVMGDSVRQVVTGLVVNDKASLPREIRRRLRAAEHRQRLARKMVQVAGARPAGPMTNEQLHGWQSFRSMTERFQVPKEWTSPLAATLEDRLLRAEELTWSVSCLNGLPFFARSRGECLKNLVEKAGNWSHSDVKSLLKRIRGTDVVRSHFVESLAAIDRDIEQWRSRKLGAVEGLVVMSGSERGLLALGIDYAGTCQVIGVEPDLEATNTVHWQKFFRDLYSRSMTGVGWFSATTAGSLDAWRSVWSDLQLGIGSFQYVNHSFATKAGIDPASVLRFLPALSADADPRQRRIAWAALITSKFPLVLDRLTENSEQSIPPARPLMVHSVGWNYWSVLSQALLRRELRGKMRQNILLRFSRTSREGEITGYAVPYAAISEGLQTENLSKFSYPIPISNSFDERYRWQIRIVNDVLSVVKDNQDVWSCLVRHFRFGPDEVIGS